MYVADDLSRAYLPDQGEPDKEFQVFALKVETLIKSARLPNSVK